MPEQQRRRPVLDLATNRIGEVRDRLTKDGQPAVWLRPVGGGREWTTLRENLAPLPQQTGTTP